MKYLLGLMLLPLLLSPAFAESPEDYEQVLPSEKGTLDIGLTVDPPAKVNEVSKTEYENILSPFQINDEQFIQGKKIINAMLEVTIKNDATLVEVNP